MAKKDAFHLPDHITDALNDSGIDEDALDEALTALAELGINVTMRDTINEETYLLKPADSKDVMRNDDGDVINATEPDINSGDDEG